MKQITIETSQGNYPVKIGYNILHHVKDVLTHKQRILVITDENVSKYHLETLKTALEPYAFTCFTLSNQPELDKTLIRYQKLLDFAIKEGFDRHLTVLAFGGGAVGDFAGFFAATYKRGVNFYQIPTTLLAHDSSVGGKVALNHPPIKNIIGSFYQPELVLYDLQFLKTLPYEEIQSGFGELIKHDLLRDGSLVKSQINLDELYNNQELLMDYLYQAILTKYNYIKTDIYDQLGMRQYLNLGHTLGHGIEVIYDMTHGEAILLGTCFDLFLHDENWGLELFNQFKNWGYFKQPLQLDEKSLLTVLRHDKKNEQDRLIFISLKDYGKPYAIQLNDEEFSRLLDKFNNVVMK
jgi:3-dehydroquinate synthase